MAWFKVDDSFHVHPDVVRLLEAKGGGAAVGLWTIAGSYCAQLLTNGLLSSSLVRRWGFTKKHADLLVSVGLWERTKDGYQFRNWLKYQPSKESVEANREAAKRRMKRHRARERSAEQTAGVQLPRPDPTRSKLSSESSARGSDSSAWEEFNWAYGALCFERGWTPHMLTGQQRGHALERTRLVQQQHGCDLAEAARRLMAAAHAEGGDVYLALRKVQVPKPAPSVADPYAGAVKLDSRAEKGPARHGAAENDAGYREGIRRAENG